MSGTSGLGTFSFVGTAEAGGSLDEYELGRWDQAELTPGKYIVVYQQSTTLRYFAQVVNAVDDLTPLDLGGQATIESSPSAAQDLSVVALSATKAVVMYHNAVDGKLTMRVLNVDGSDGITVGTAATFTLTNQPTFRFDPSGRKFMDSVDIDDSNFYVWHTNQFNGGNTWQLSKFNVSGDTITQSGSTTDSRTVMGGSWNLEENLIGDNTWRISRTLTVGIDSLGTSATWNPSDKHPNITLSGGNLTITNPSSGNTRYGIRSTNSVTSGKFYWECLMTSQYASYGIVGPAWNVGSSTIETSGPQVTYYGAAGALIINGGGGVLDSHVSTAFVGGDRISIIFDNDNGKIWFAKNGTLISGDPAAGTNPSATFTPGTWYAGTMLQHLGGNSVTTTNFGATAFTYPELVPTGFFAGFGPIVPGSSEYIIQSGKSVGVIDDSFTKVSDLSDSSLDEKGVTFELSTGVYVNMGTDQKFQLNTSGTWGGDFDFSIDNASEVKDVIRVTDNVFAAIQTVTAPETKHLQFIKRLNDELWRHQTNSISTRGLEIFSTATDFDVWWEGDLRLGEIGEMIYAIDGENFALFHAPQANNLEITVAREDELEEVFTEPDFDNLDAHYDAHQDTTSNLVLSGSDVTEWLDISGNGRDQTTAFGIRPTLEVGAANGNDCIRFTQNSFTGVTWTGGDCTITAVMKVNRTAVAAVGFAILSGFTGNLSCGQWNQTSNASFAFNTLGGDAFGSGSGLLSLSEYTVMTIYVDSGNLTSGMRLFFNDLEMAVSQITGSTSNSAVTGTTFDVGDLGTNSFPYRGDICEVYLNAELISDADRIQLTGFLKNKWGIGDDVLTLIGKNSFNGASGNLSFPADTTAGDLAIVMFIEGDASPPVIGSGWTLLDSQAGVLTGSSYSIYSKTLVQADIDTPVAFVTVNGGYQLVVYRNHNTITFKGNTTGTGSTSTVTGFTKNASSVRILSWWVDRDVTNFVIPPGFSFVQDTGITFFSLGIQEILSTDYTNGTNIVVTVGLGGSGFAHAQSVLEIT